MTHIEQELIDSGVLEDCTALVSAALHREVSRPGGFAVVRAVPGLYSDTADWSAEKCKSWIVEDGPGIDYLDAMCGPCPGDRCDPVCACCLRKVVEGYAPPNAVVRWLRVTAPLADALVLRGSVVAMLDGARYWGMTE